MLNLIQNALKIFHLNFQIQETDELIWIETDFSIEKSVGFYIFKRYQRYLTDEGFITEPDIIEEIQDQELVVARLVELIQEKIDVCMA